MVLICRILRLLHGFSGIPDTSGGAAAGALTLSAPARPTSARISDHSGRHGPWVTSGVSSRFPWKEPTMVVSKHHVRIATLSLGAVLTLPLAAGAADTPRQVTFSKDVAPIFQARCQSCHEP